jgi:hypothetical protein
MEQAAARGASADAEGDLEVNALTMQRAAEQTFRRRRG